MEGCSEGVYAKINSSFESLVITGVAPDLWCCKYVGRGLTNLDLDASLDTTFGRNHGALFVGDSIRNGIIKRFCGCFLLSNHDMVPWLDGGNFGMMFSVMIPFGLLFALEVWF